MSGSEAAEQKMTNATPIIVQVGRTFAVAADGGAPVDVGDFRRPFPFTGKLDELTLFDRSVYLRRIA